MNSVNGFGKRRCSGSQTDHFDPGEPFRDEFFGPFDVKHDLVCGVTSFDQLSGVVAGSSADHDDALPPTSINFRSADCRSFVGLQTVSTKRTSLCGM